RVRGAQYAGKHRTGDTPSAEPLSSPSCGQRLSGPGRREKIGDSGVVPDAAAVGRARCSATVLVLENRRHAPEAVNTQAVDSLWKTYRAGARRTAAPTGCQALGILGTTRGYAQVIEETIDLATVWAAATEELSDGLVSPQQRAYLKLTQLRALVEDTALLAVPDAFTRDVIESRLRPAITEALSRRLGRMIQVAVTVRPRTDGTSEAPPYPAAPPAGPPAPEPWTPTPPGNPAYDSRQAQPPAGPRDTPSPFRVDPRYDPDP